MEANSRRCRVDGEARHAISAIRSLSQCVPASLGVGDVPGDTASLDMLDEHDRTWDRVAGHIDNAASKVGGKFTCVRDERQEQQEG